MWLLNINKQCVWGEILNTYQWVGWAVAIVIFTNVKSYVLLTILSTFSLE